MGKIDRGWFGEALLAERTRRGLDMQGMADLVGTTRSTYASWEGGRRNAPVNVATEALYKLGLTVQVTPIDRVSLEVRVEHIEAALADVFGRLRRCESDNGGPADAPL